VFDQAEKRRPPRVSRLPQPAVGTARPDELGVGAALYAVPTS